MANESNLKPVRTKKEARERGRNGGIKSGEVRRERKTLKEELLLLLSSNDTQKKISTALIEQAQNGNTEVKCVDYVKDETKIKKPEKHLETTAKQHKPIMRDLV